MFGIHTTHQPKLILSRTLYIGATVLTVGLSGCGTVIDSPVRSSHIQTCFNPGENCTQFVQEAIGKAEKSILVQAYYFTSRPIADALIKAHQGGITVRVLVDRSQLEYEHTQIYRMLAKGISIKVDPTPGSAHSKVMIIDDAYVLTGSFNWTQAAAQRNVENLLLVHDPKINQAYYKEWHRRAAKAQVIRQKQRTAKKKAHTGGKPKPSSPKK